MYTQNIYQIEDIPAPSETPIRLSQQWKKSAQLGAPQGPCCHIFALLTVIPRLSPAPHVGSHVLCALQKSRAAVAEPQSTQGFPPTESLRMKSV